MNIKGYRRIVPMLLLLLHLVLLFQMQQQKLHELSVGKPYTQLTTVQLLDMSLNFPAYLAAFPAALVWDHRPILFLFYVATVFIPFLWYATCLGIDSRIKYAKAPASSLIWRICRRLIGTLAILAFLSSMFIVTLNGHYQREEHWLGTAGMIWFGVLAVASFWPRTRQSKAPNYPGAPHVEPSHVVSLMESLPGNEQRIARMGDRIVAALLDGVLSIPIFVGTGALTAHRYHIPADADGSVTLRGGPALFVMFLGTVLWCAYHFLFEWLSGKTLGKEIMAIEVLASNREKCRSGRAFVRNLLRPIDAFGFYLLGFLVALFSSSNQRIGDRVAGTIVWENSSARRKLAALAWLVANILLAYAAVLLVRLAR